MGISAPYGVLGLKGYGLAVDFLLIGGGAAGGGHEWGRDGGVRGVRGVRKEATGPVRAAGVAGWRSGLLSEERCVSVLCVYFVCTKMVGRG